MPMGCVIGVDFTGKTTHKRALTPYTTRTCALRECLLAVHHAGTALVTQLLDQTSADGHCWLGWLCCSRLGSLLLLCCRCWGLGLGLCLLRHLGRKVIAALLQALAQVVLDKATHLLSLYIGFMC